jgi:hypothetical protein
LLLGGCLSGCAGDHSTVDRCNTVLSWSSHPLGTDFLIADPVPVSLSDEGLNLLLGLAPPTARNYESFCAAIRSNGLFLLTPNIPEPVEQFTFRQENGQWKFIETTKIYYMR